MLFNRKQTVEIDLGHGATKEIELNRKPISQKARELFLRFPVHGIIIAIGLIWLLPTIGLFVSSFRTPAAIRRSGWWHAFIPPSEFTLENYIDVLTEADIANGFINSLTIAIPSTVMPILIAAFAAYALARFVFPGRDLLFLIIVGLLIVPLQMTLVPLLRIFTGLNLTGRFPSVWIAHASYGLSFAIYLLRNYIGGIPGEIFDIAEIDGADDFMIFYRLVLPLTVPAIASLAIFQFIWAWNDLIVSLVYLGGTPDVAPLTVAISQLVGSRGRGWHLLTSAAFISMVLPLAVFFGLQRYFIRGILAGSVKG